MLRSGTICYCLVAGVKSRRSHESGELKQNKRNITKNRRLFLLKVEDKIQNQMKIAKIIKCVLRTIIRNRVSDCGPFCVLKTQS